MSTKNDTGGIVLLLTGFPLMGAAIGGAAAYGFALGPSLRGACCGFVIFAVLALFSLAEGA